jgi:ABC-type Mn2+/Zn2+ transport system permease subunit
MLATLLAVLNRMPMLAAALAKVAVAGAETAFRANGMPIGSTVVKTGLNIRWLHWWLR